MGERLTRAPGERTSDYLARMAGKLAETSLVARERGDEVHAIFFAVKASELLKLAKAFGFDGRAALSEDAHG